MPAVPGVPAASVAITAAIIVTAQTTPEPELINNIRQNRSGSLLALYHGQPDQQPHGGDDGPGGAGLQAAAEGSRSHRVQTELVQPGQ